jgi:hypothetical protein
LILRDHIDDIHSKATGAVPHPEMHNIVHRGPDLGILLVQIRLLEREKTEIVLSRL